MARISSKKSRLEKVILSRGRSDTITTHKILRDPVLVVPESEFGAYKKATGLSRIIKIPDEVAGLGAVRNWVLARFKQRCLVMFDDDIHKLFCITREAGFDITDPVDIDQVIINTAQCCDDAGARVFGFNRAWDVRKYLGNKPFRVKGWVGGVIGVIGRQLHFDESNKLRVDVDFCLQNLLENRIIWKDDRFSFVQKRFSNRGGNSIYRTREVDKQEREYLSSKWGAYVVFRKTAAGITIQTKVTRTNHPNKIGIRV